ncbi:MAG: uridine diphosphate-N-acetylglucosamine-binding protein YvcK, partial [Nanoarchaeota archaeon]|nr:uridine diphosphate-N-acetylglucosamine-binding protein YvcK [Nanoarchaeota archaeon]
GINGEFDLIVIDDISENLSKEDRFLGAMRSFNFKTDEILVVGDRIFSEIRVGNMLGMTTIRLIYGGYSTLKPKNGLETPDYEINKIPEILDLLEDINKKRQLKVVVIGGGTGLPTLLEGLKKYTKNLTAIVGVTDAGRSSGMLRNEFDIAPPGDIRNCLVALSDSERLLADLFQYRFMNGKLEGHTLGNLFITALTQVTGSFDEAIQKASKILNIKGDVFPSTPENIHINAELENGDILERESGIVNRTDKNVHERSKIKKVFLDKPDVKASKGAIKAIKEADVVVIGPGSLYTSVVTNLLVKDISRSIKESKAVKVYVCNIMTQPTQTFGFNASDHVNVIEKYLGKEVLDYVIFNDKKPPKDLLDKYEQDFSDFIELDEGLHKIKAKKVITDLVEDIDKIEVLWNKRNLLRHDSSKIAEIIFNLK